MTRNITARLTVGVTFSAALALLPFGRLDAGGTGVGIFEPQLPVDQVFPSTPIVTAPVPLQTASAEGTAYVTNGIREAYALCSSLAQSEYTVDCLRDRIQSLAGTMPESGDYAAAKEVLEDTAQKLGNTVRRTRSISQPPARVQATVNNTPVVTGPLTPVRAEAVADAIAEAVDILDEAETMLLRSAANSDRRAVHYQAMAEAVGSNKILLRSL